MYTYTLQVVQVAEVIVYTILKIDISTKGALKATLCAVYNAMIPG